MAEGEEKIPPPPPLEPGPPSELPISKPTYKIIVLGNSGVGKTSLTYRFCNGKFPDGNVDATIGVDFREKIIRLPYLGQPGSRQSGGLMRLQLWDTAGQERYRKSMVPHYYRNVSGIVLVYDVGNLESFNALAKWVEESRQHNLTPDHLPMIIIGNKLDGNMPETKMEVKTKIAQR